MSSVRPASADPDRIADRLQQLWAIASGPAGGADRPAYSAAEAQAMRLVAGWASELGLAPGVDAHGNLWALPRDWDGPLVTAGSHVDTVPDGGRYDGALGTVLGLELVASLPAPTSAGARAALLVCAAEEAPRFGAGTVGSRLMTGALDDAALRELTDATGVSAFDARAGYLELLADLPRITPPTDRIRAHAEVHVALRRALRELNVVTTIASPRRFAIQITGEAGHAGEISMGDRHDALAGAAEVVLAIESAARAEPQETVATVGVLDVSPGAVSVIPQRASLLVDVRGVSAESLGRVETALRDAVARVATGRGLGTEVTLRRSGEPVTMDRGLIDAALAAARELGLAAAETWSGSGHDAQHVAAFAPALLVFVPLHGGEGHTPQEGADLGEIVDAADVVHRVLDRA